ncbi:MAG: hypothetical protein RL459_1851, partial [Pseudomonadota bacterium]
MNDIRRTILWVIFGFSMVLLWDRWQIHTGNKATFFPTPAAVSTASSVATGASLKSNNPPAPTAKGVASAPVAGDAQQQIAREQFEVVTDVLKLGFDSEGGSLVRAELLKHASLNDKNKNFVLLDDSKERVYLAQTGLIGGASAAALPNHKTVMKVLSTERALKDGTNELTVRFESPEVGGVKLIKSYVLTRGSYAIKVQHEVLNVGTAAVSPELYLQLVRDGNKPPGESSFYSTFTGPAIYTDAKKYQKVEFSDIKSKKVDVEKEASNGYVAMVQHYFASAWILPDGVKRSFSLDAVDIGSSLADCCYRATMIAPLEAIAPGAAKAVEAKFFAGPQEEKV